MAGGKRESTYVVLVRSTAWSGFDKKVDSPHPKIARNFPGGPAQELGFLLLKVNYTPTIMPSWVKGLCTSPPYVIWYQVLFLL